MNKITLTEQEKKTLKLISAGLTSKEIGDILCKSPRTIEDYRARLYEKFNVKNKAQLITYIYKNKLLD